MQRGIFWAATLGAAVAWADVPAGYKGTPYLGAARELPGRIDFEHYDMGGPGVGWKHDNKAGAAGSFAGGRENDGEAQHPSFYMTNNNPGEQDKLPDGTLYPSAALPKSVYIGASHATDWMNVTVKVTRPGDYWLSSHFASEGNTIKVHVKFNGVNRTGSVTIPGTNGYHNWRHYPAFAKVTLDTGLQVMQFYLEQAHVNWDYVSFSQEQAASLLTLRNHRDLGFSRPGVGGRASGIRVQDAFGRLFDVRGAILPLPRGAFPEGGKKAGINLGTP